MSESYYVNHVPLLGEFGNVVPDGYLYYQKLVTPSEDLSLANAYFKWYDIYPPEAAITPAQRAECRAFVAAEAQRLQFAQELGFVLLHRAGSVLLLMIMTWRNTNEIWESVYVKDLTQNTDYRLQEFEGSHRGTFCVWELAPVWHERHAWARLLASQRDEEAKLAYINDRFSDLV
jgi:hypothetical protein